MPTFYAGSLNFANSITKFDFSAGWLKASPEITSDVAMGGDAIYLRYGWGEDATQTLAARFMDSASDGLLLELDYLHGGNVTVSSYPNGDFISGLFDGAPVSGRVALELRRDVARYNIDGGSWTGISLAEIKESWISDWEKDNYWRFLSLQISPNPAIVIDTSQYENGEQTPISITGWTANNFTFSYFRETGVRFWTDTRRCREVA